MYLRLFNVAIKRNIVTVRHINVIPMYNGYKYNRKSRMIHAIINVNYCSPLWC